MSGEIAGNSINVNDLFRLNNTTINIDGIDVNNKFRVDYDGRVEASEFYGNGQFLTNVRGTWQETGNDFYYLDGNIGIGTSTPTSDLTIEGDNPQIHLKTTIAGGYDPSIRFEGFNSAYTSISYLCVICCL